MSANSDAGDRLVDRALQPWKAGLIEPGQIWEYWERTHRFKVLEPPQGGTVLVIMAGTDLGPYRVPQEYLLDACFVVGRVNP